MKPLRDPTAADLYGTWRLVSYTQRVVATGETSQPFGRSPSGFLSYSPEGRMHAILVKDERPRPAEMAQATVEERTQLYDSLAAYAGKFTVAGDAVTHHVDISWNGTWTGTDQVRKIRLEGDRLYIASVPRPSSTDGELVVAELVWERVR